MNRTSIAITLVISQLTCGYVVWGLNKTIVPLILEKTNIQATRVVRALCGIRVPNSRCSRLPPLCFHFLEQMTGLDCEVWSPRGFCLTSLPSTACRWISWRWIWSWHPSPTWDISLPTEAVMSLYGLLRLTFVTVELAKHLVCKPAATISLYFENSFLKIKLNKI